MDNIFEEYKDNPPRAKNLPPVAGSIVWSRSVFERIKVPIQKLNTREGLLQGERGKDASLQYF